MVLGDILMRSVWSAVSYFIHISELIKKSRPFMEELYKNFG